MTLGERRPSSDNVAVTRVERCVGGVTPSEIFNEKVEIENRMLRSSNADFVTISGSCIFEIKNVSRTRTNIYMESMYVCTHLRTNPSHDDVTITIQHCTINTFFSLAVFLKKMLSLLKYLLQLINNSGC